MASQRTTNQHPPDHPGRCRVSTWMRRTRHLLHLAVGYAAAAAMPLFLLSAGATFAGIAVDSTSSTNAYAPAGNQITWSHTVGSGANRILVVGVSLRRSGDSEQVTGLDFGGSPLTFIGAEESTDGNSKFRAELWYLPAPAPGTNTITVQFSGPVNSAVGGATSFTGVDPTAPVGTFAGAGGTLGNPSVTVASAEGEVVIDTIAINGDKSNAVTPGAGQAQQWSDQPGNDDWTHTIGGGSTRLGAASVTMSWAVVAENQWAMAAVPLRPAATVTTTLYLKGDGVPSASLSPDVPTASTLPDYDPGRDVFPGLVIAKGGSGPFETDATKYQQWISLSDQPALDGPVSLVFWSAMKDFDTGKRGVVEAYLLDCDAQGADCSLIAQGMKDVSDWSGGWGSWNEFSIEFGNITYLVPLGRSLAVKLVAGNGADDDMYLAYDTASYPSRLTDGAPSDIVVDCDVSDWSDAEGTEFDVSDQGGPDDWGSPARLDLTRFAVSTNTVDTFHILMGFDDATPQGVTAGVLIDTNVDGWINSAFVATLDGSVATVELYSCDNSLIDGCGGAMLERTYPPSTFCLGSDAGPWNTDSFLETTLPFQDLTLYGDQVILSSLVSYAAASLLTSPKDAIFGGSGQDYDARISYNSRPNRATNGNTTTVGYVGAGSVVRRSTDPSAVRTAAVHASVTEAPFDDDFGSLSDGEMYFYVVEREGGSPVSLSVTANPSADAPRLGFDDGDALSAPADAFQTKVALSASSIRADGTSSVTVTIVPRDSDGMDLGAGCVLSMDALTLSPGMLAGPVQDHMNGRYTFQVISTGFGTGTVAVSVEGIALASQPAITYTAP